MESINPALKVYLSRDAYFRNSTWGNPASSEQIQPRNCFAPARSECRNPFLCTWQWKPSSHCSPSLIHTCCCSWAVAAMLQQRQPLLWSSCFGKSLCCWLAGWTPSVSLGYPPGPSPVAKYHMFPHVEHINNFLPIIPWHCILYLFFFKWWIGCKCIKNEENAQKQLDFPLKKKERKKRNLCSLW